MKFLNSLKKEIYRQYSFYIESNIQLWCTRKALMQLPLCVNKTPLFNFTFTLHMHYLVAIPILKLLISFFEWKSIYQIWNQDGHEKSNNHILPWTIFSAPRNKVILHYMRNCRCTNKEFFVFMSLLEFLLELHDAICTYFNKFKNIQ